MSIIKYLFFLNTTVLMARLLINVVCDVYNDVSEKEQIVFHFHTTKLIILFPTCQYIS